jgi:rubrerythrin
MGSLFSARELINVAITEEQTGATYYRAIAEKTESAEMKKFALETAAMEDEHEQKFKDLLESVGDYEATGESREGEYEDYMAYMLEGRIFPRGQDGVALAEQQASDAEAAQTAMDLERNTLLFYQEMLKFVPESQQGLLDGIIAEERQHLIGWANFRKQNA